jgi:hypothetical protein
MDYQLKPLGKTCARTGREFQPGDTCYSALIEKGQQWVRVDFHWEAWQGPPDGALGYWKCTVPRRDEIKRRVIDPDALLRRFEQLCEDANPVQEPFRYVLALLLVQRRRLRIDGTRTEGAVSFLRLVGLQGEGPFEVREQQLQEAEIAALQRELEDQFAVEVHEQVE